MLSENTFMRMKIFICYNYKCKGKGKTKKSEYLYKKNVHPFCYNKDSQGKPEGLKEKKYG